MLILKKSESDELLKINSAEVDVSEVKNQKDLIAALKGELAQLFIPFEKLKIKKDGEGNCLIFWNEKKLDSTTRKVLHSEWVAYREMIKEDGRFEIVELLTPVYLETLQEQSATNAAEAA